MDSEPEVARDAGPMNVREAKAALDYHAAKAAKRGDYGCVTDLSCVRDTIDQLVEQIDDLRSAGGDIVRKILASRESLSRLP